MLFATPSDDAFRSLCGDLPTPPAITVTNRLQSTDHKHFRPQINELLHQLCARVILARRPFFFLRTCASTGR